jgi:ubiquinone/menaquinone biosynthesis C-methylase UbiE
MELQTAVKLISYHRLPAYSAVWADLGCGTGLFTQALVSLLQPGSKIYAVDQNKQALQQIPTPPTIGIEKIAANFVTDPLPLKDLDGILMANALHFVKDKTGFLRTIAGYCKPNAALLIVEYDMDTPNTWVPYPLSFTSLESLFRKAGYKTVEKIHSTPSVYNRSLIYGTFIER